MSNAMKFLVIAVVIGVVVPLVSFSLGSHPTANKVLFGVGIAGAAVFLAASALSWRRSRLP
jgi:hypothetical protein